MKEKEKDISVETTDTESKTSHEEAVDNTTPPAPKKKLSKKMCIGIIAVFAVISFILGMIFINFPGSDNLFSKTKSFSVEEMNITLPKDFNQLNNVKDFDACYGTEDVIIYVKKDDFQSNSNLALYSIENYRLSLLHEKEMSYNDLIDAEGTVYFKYNYVNETTGTAFTYYTFTYETADAFWMIQFAVEQSKAPSYESNIIEWAKTITFNNTAESK